ncbi:MAG TPA: flagellar basal body P-ring formation chaperone FlgA [Kofleriaceae bacterium]|nr:flagellar basal body P-ring formation chaperone FlgA [Kofleriaceae bacterium]
MSARAVQLAVLAALTVGALAPRAAAEPKKPSSEPAEPLEATIRDRLSPALPDGLDVARVYLPASLASARIEPSKVVVELPRELRAGRPSIKLTVRGKPAVWVPVAIATTVEVAVAQRDLAPGDVITDDDIAVERRAVADLTPAAPATVVGASVTAAIAAGAPIGSRMVALPPPLSRGTQVSVEIHRGAVRIHGTATLETSARPGEQASARLAQTKLVVHGTLVAPATLIVGE